MSDANLKTWLATKFANKAVAMKEQAVFTLLHGNYPPGSLAHETEVLRERLADMYFRLACSLAGAEIE